MIEFHRLQNLRSDDFFFEKVETGALQAAAKIGHLVRPAEVGDEKMTVRAQDPIHFLEKRSKDP